MNLFNYLIVIAFIGIIALISYFIIKYLNGGKDRKLKLFNNITLKQFIIFTYILFFIFITLGFNFNNIVLLADNKFNDESINLLIFLGVIYFITIIFSETDHYLSPIKKSSYKNKIFDILYFFKINAIGALFPVYIFERYGFFIKDTCHPYQDMLNLTFYTVCVTFISILVTSLIYKGIISTITNTGFRRFINKINDPYYYIN